MDRDEWLRQVTILDFMATDLQLYLDTHPDDASAIENYKTILAEGKKARDRYERCYGPLSSRGEITQDDHWRWVDDPWPWEERYNLRICGRSGGHVGF
ncbi:MAG: spore coat protein CotJB [Clostridiales bacterium]|nr:spore coat protein CotJB [Clostridiales bacterium]